MSILLIIASCLAATLYVAAWLGAANRTPPAALAPDAGPVPVRRLDAGTLLLAAGVVSHGVAMHAAMAAGGGGVRFGFGPALSATFWVGVAVLWFEGLSVRAEALRTAVLPAAAVAVLLPLFFPGSVYATESHRPLFIPHLVVGTLAYGVLMLAALHAALMTAAERALHGAPGASSSIFARWLEELPPLLVLERILFRFIAVGFVLLTLTAVSGIAFSEQVFGRPLRLEHKSVFTIAAWALFGVLLVGRARWGWRGRTALRLTLAGFFVLLLAYVGSRFVLEVLLGRG